MDSPSANPERLNTELSLLNAMYTSSLGYNPTSSELTFHCPSSPKSRLILRLPSDYPSKSTPQVISACDSSQQDVRSDVVKFVNELPTDEGEVLDLILQSFSELIDQRCSTKPIDSPLNKSTSTTPTSPPEKTIIIWLHHLLATSKRKLALHPSISSNLISGITKPGYPGVLLFTGSQKAVDEHVSELKAQNWQAFQVRYEEEEVWELSHASGEGGGDGDGKGRGIREVESMAEVVAGIVGEERREMFLRVVGVK